MRLLLANDDGVYSPGLRFLAEIASSFGEVRIVAPDFEQSSMGHAITAWRPLSYRRVRVGNFEAYRVNGTPADCVALGIYNWDKIDVVLSGINLGFNLGNSMWHSGTLAAAKQATLFDVRGVALSAPPVDAIEAYADLRPWVTCVLEQILSLPEAPLLINVNFPLVPHGTQWTKQSVRHYDGRIVPAKDPTGQPHYWFIPVPLEGVDPHTDRAAIDAGLVSMTPLRLDLTDRAMLDVLSKREAEATRPGCLPGP